MHLEGKHKNITDENNIQHDSVLHTNKLLERSLEERAKKYEEDRMGQGRFVAPVVGALAQVATLGNAGSNIGGPTSAEKSFKNLQENTKPLKPKEGKND